MPVYYSDTTTINGSNRVGIHYATDTTQCYTCLKLDESRNGRLVKNPDSEQAQAQSLYFETHYTEHINPVGSPVFVDENGALSLTPYNTADSNSGRVYGYKVGEIISTTKIKMSGRKEIYTGNNGGNNDYFAGSYGKIDIPSDSIEALYVGIGNARKIKLDIEVRAGNGSVTAQYYINKDEKLISQFFNSTNGSTYPVKLIVEFVNNNNEENLSLLKIYNSSTTAPAANALNAIKGYK